MTGRAAVFTAAALGGFAANSILCRSALRPDLADPATFTAVRLLSGALALAVIARSAARAGAGPVLRAGQWRSAAALFAYAAGFSYAYRRLPAAAGALLLFGAVQATMLAGALRAGARPHGRQVGGWLLAGAGLVALLSPGLTAPDPGGAALMIGAGVAWGVYSLRGRAVPDPVVATAGNFSLAVPLALALTAAAALRAAPHASARGLVLAAASGVVASGIGYSLWYAALPELGATRAAVVQLLVPVLVAGAGVALLDEPLTPRLALCAVAVLGGVALAVVGRPPRNERL
jgi:drug/metabolite transporter (DMT)-like permease